MLLGVFVILILFFGLVLVSGMLFVVDGWVLDSCYKMLWFNDVGDV